MSTVTESLAERLRAIWRRPRSLTSLVPVGVTSVEELHARLLALAPRLTAALERARIPDLHAFRMAAVPAAEGARGSVRVLVNTVHDDPRDVHLPALIAAAGDLLAEALAGAAYSGRPEDVPALLVRHRAADHTLHLGAINASVADILAEERLLNAIEELADEQLANGEWGAATPAERIRREIRAHVLASPESAGLPRGPATRVPWVGRWLRVLDIVTTFALPTIGVLAPHIQRAIRRIENPGTRALAWLGYGLWWIYGAVFTVGALLFVRLLEKIEEDIVAAPADPQKVAQIEAAEDLQLKNAVAIWFPVRRTWIRRALLRLILWGSDRGCRHFWTNGALAEIDTIHYARILQVDGGRTMLFMSDYDGSLDRYLLDFLGVGSSAVIPISSNVEGCPKTRWLFYQDDASTFGPRWRNMIRCNQVEIPVWFSAYPNLSVRDVLSNRALRAGLFVPEMSEAEASRWTARL